MSNYLPDTCAGCDQPITPAVGVYYCSLCIAEQMAERAKELRAFNALHAWADRVARGETR